MNLRPTRIEIDPAAISRNVTRLAEISKPANLWAVVKANGYGHGATTAAQAALTGGAEAVCVAMVEEGVALRDDGIDGRIVVLSEPTLDAIPDLIGHRLEATVCTSDFITELARRVGASEPERDRHLVHLKIDTGMHRVGVRPEQALERAAQIEDAPVLELASVWTHLAVADEPDRDFTTVQLARLNDAVRLIRASGIAVPVTHAANSAGLLAHPVTHLDVVRPGIAIYGIEPSPQCSDAVAAAGLEPALRLVTEVSNVQVIPAGEGISYGLRYRPAHDSTIATIPIGYADGLRRALGEAGGAVLIGGRRRPIAGTVTMDQVMVDCGPGGRVTVGDEVVLLGSQGGERVRPEEWADLLDTIGYEVTCGLGSRVPRVVV